MSKLRLFLIRHGETVWSRERRFAGSRDVPLAPEGLRQCEAVATTLASQIVATVYASPLERARASAEVIARPHRLPVVTEPAFLAARFPDDYERWRTTPHLLRIGGGETLGEVGARVTAGVRELLEAHDGETVVLVSHAVVIRLVVLAALGLGHERLWTVDAAPAGITEIEYEPGWATVHRMNTLAHLEALKR